MEATKGMLYGLSAGATYGVIYNFVSEFENDLREKALERYGHLVQRFSKPPPAQFHVSATTASVNDTDAMVRRFPILLVIR